MGTDKTTRPVRPGSAGKDRQFVVALARGLSLLACFRVNRPLLTNGELARLTGLPCSSVSRLSHTLIKLGYLDYDSRHAAYRLGARNLSLGNAMLGGMDLRALALPFMSQLAERANSLVALATCEDASMLIVEVVRGRRTRALPLEVGAHVGIDTSAMGRAYVAVCSTAEREAIRARLLADRRRSAVKLRTDLDRAIADYRHLGYTTSIDDWRTGVNGVAVPLFLKNYGRRMVLTCGGPARQLTAVQIRERIGPQLVQCAVDIEASFDRLLDA